MYDRKEDLSQMYALELKDMRGWCEEMLDLANIPEGPFRKAYITELFAGDSDSPYKLWRYIQDSCEPETQSEEIDECLTCPKCCEKKSDVEFKTDLGDGEGDVMVCEDCYNILEEEDEEEDEVDYLPNNDKINIVRSALITLAATSTDMLILEEKVFEKVLQVRKDLETLMGILKEEAKK